MGQDLGPNAGSTMAMVLVLLLSLCPYLFALCGLVMQTILIKYADQTIVFHHEREMEEKYLHIL